MNNLLDMFDLGQLISRAIKYFVEGLVVGIAVLLVSKKRMNLDEVALIALTAAATMVLLDTYVPSMSSSFKQSAGWGLGFRLVGFPTM